jgi:hypothetical protein
VASLRGAQPIWKSFAVGGTGAGTDLSPLVNIGVGVNVAVFVKNETATSATFKLQCSVPAGGQVGAGMNIAPDTWYDYTKPGGTVITLVVPGNTQLMVDLSPFSPEYLRLANTSGATTVSAFVSSYGVN